MDNKLPSDSYIQEKNKFSNKNIEINKNLITSWQQKIITYQRPLFQNQKEKESQIYLFEEPEIIKINDFNPLSLRPLPISFWRLKGSESKGPAMYFVMDIPEHSRDNLLLYIGETINAEKRWKGEHDCKSYLSSYSEALSLVGLRHQLTIRFWMDVSSDTKARRFLEKSLIKKWLPPFNKETRKRWTTPFTSDS